MCKNQKILLIGALYLREQEESKAIEHRLILIIRFMQITDVGKLHRKRTYI